MQVDTGELKALREEVGALSRKVSTLTGRTTVMGNHMGRLSRDLHDDLEPMAKLVLWLMDYRRPGWREPARHTAPKRHRHLHAVDLRKPRALPARQHQHRDRVLKCAGTWSTQEAPGW
jgi:hypothetical protein